MLDCGKLAYYKSGTSYRYGGVVALLLRAPPFLPPDVCAAVQHGRTTAEELVPAPVQLQR